MNAAEFFKLPKITLPCRREQIIDRNLNIVTPAECTNFADEYQKRVDCFYELLKDVQNDSDDILKTIWSILKDNKYYERIARAIKFCQNGLPVQGYKEFEYAISSISGWIKWLNYEHEADINLHQLYRMRIKKEYNSFEKFDKKNMFHIPFSMRYLASRQRYSLPGMPCLYLGGSLYVCWEEMGQPMFDSICFSRFKPSDNKNLRLLDFGYRPGQIGSLIESTKDSCYTKNSDDFNFVCAQGITWPLLAACSFINAKREAPFIPEYIVPQMILQWIVETNKFDGIRYFSVLIENDISNPKMACNYVFPAIENDRKDSNCISNSLVNDIDLDNLSHHLIETFSFTEPLHWSILEHTHDFYGKASLVPQQRNIKIDLVNNHHVHYNETPFGAMEAKSLAFATHPLKKQRVD